MALLFFTAVVALGALTTGADAKMRGDRLWLVTAGGKEFPIEIEVAELPQDKSLGLMFRTELAGDHGMLFPYDQSQDVSMWMHNTYIPLDMVFIRADGTVHRIESRAEPLSDRIINSGGPVKAVLELPAGTSERLGLKPGDHVRYPLFSAPAP